MNELQITYVPTDSLIPYANNARAHGDHDVDAIMASIREFGFNDPIGIWKGIIVEGHGRLLAAKRLGMERVPVIELDHLTDEQRKAYALTHNKTAELSEWDFDVLNSELADIADIDMSEFGFDDIDENPPEKTNDGDVEDSNNLRVAVKIIFPSVKEWRENEDVVREFVDGLGIGSVSVGGDKEGDV